MKKKLEKFSATAIQFRNFQEIITFQVFFYNLTRS
jgi:hypothetical protein